MFISWSPEYIYRLWKLGKHSPDGSRYVSGARLFIARVSMLGYAAAFNKAIVSEQKTSKATMDITRRTFRKLDRRKTSKVRWAFAQGVSDHGLCAFDIDSFHFSIVF